MNPIGRQFLKTSTATSLASTLSLPAVHATHHGGKKYRTALIGSGWWGMNILNEAMRAGYSKVVAVCDVDERQLQPALKHVEDASGDKPKAYRDYREML